MAPRYGSEGKTIGAAWRGWTRRRSPRILATGLVLAIGLRLALGGFTWRDGVAAAAMLVIYPFGEWAIHVYLLHLKPFRWRGRVVELPTATSHRLHHESPHELGMILLGPREAAGLLCVAVPLVPALACGIVALAGGTVPVD